MTEVSEVFTGVPTLTLDKVEELKKWHGVMMDAFQRASVPEYRAYFDGYARGIEDTLRLLYTEGEKAVAVVAAKSGPTPGRRLFVWGLVAGTGYVLYKRYKNGVLIPETKDDSKTIDG